VFKEEVSLTAFSESTAEDCEQSFTNLVDLEVAVKCALQNYIVYKLHNCPLGPDFTTSVVEVGQSLYLRN
jgi:hypothetical protein